MNEKLFEEDLSISYLRAIAAQAQVTFELNHRDEDSKDVDLKQQTVNDSGEPFNVEFSVQLKATYTLDDEKRIESGDGDIVCELRIDNGEPFVGFGYSKSQARMIAAELAYDYLNRNGLLYTMSDEIDEPSPEKAINQLQELAQKGYFSMPVYEFKETHDDNGNPIWTCKCSIKDLDEFYYQTSYSKKEAKKQAAYQTLLAVLESENGGDQ